MPNPEQGFAPPEAREARREPEGSLLKMDTTELVAYKQWKETVPARVRLLVEGHVLGVNVRVDTSDMPSVVEFYRGMRQMLAAPDAAVESLEVSDVVKRQLSALRQMKIGEGQINLFAALADQEIGFAVKENYVRTKLLPRLDFLRERDRRMARQAREKARETQVTGEQAEEEYTPHRAAQQEVEGLPSEAIATVDPFFGGHYADAVYDEYHPATLTWKKSPRHLQELPQQSLDMARLRRYRSTVNGAYGSVKLARGWGADRESVRWSGNEPSSWELLVDQDGIVRVRAQAGESGTFDIDIAPSADAIDLAPPEGEVVDVPDRFPGELLSHAQAIMASDARSGIKMRRIASFIHRHLEYDQDPTWEAVYKADPSRYFEAVWGNKKAKCDEANTMLTRLLTRLGMHARFIGGHSVRTKSPTGAAMLLESNRHAWGMAWDSEDRRWIRLDATPAGDPNVDQEEQQEELGEGDYGEQEAELMSEEELEKKLQEAQADDQKQIESQDPELAYAREAGCTPEEARAVLQKIAELRVKHAQVLRDADGQWQKLVRENMRERIVDRGPVPLSQMDEIDQDELVAGYIEILAGSQDPLIGMREESRRKKEHWFGGYEVYLAADMSGSMNDTINGVKKADAQRDMVFLLVDSVMNAAVVARRGERQLNASMPVKVSVVVFGKKTEIVLPLTDTWGPKEQIALYRALDAGAGGGTPDHLALARLRETITKSTQEEEEARRKKPALKNHRWRTRRFVVATADGGSDLSALVKHANDQLKQDGVPVDLLLLASEDDENLITAAEAAYQSVTPVSDVRDLAHKGLARLARRINEAYAQTI